jgi:hypothetical protein
LALLELVISRAITVEQPDRVDFAWKPADSHAKMPIRYIRISSIGYQHYGWDVMTSVLIHEFGHCDLFLQGIAERPEDSWEDRLHLEEQANARGAELTPGHLTPADYEKHREFFLRSYREHGWSMERTLSEWELYQETL